MARRVHGCIGQVITQKGHGNRNPCDLHNLELWLKGEPTTATYQYDTGTSHDFMKGRIDKKWREKQETFYRNQRQDAKLCTGELWTADLIGFLWQWSRKAWTSRNEVVHRATEHRNSERDRQIAEVKTRALYAHKVQLLVSDQQEIYADVTLEERLKQKTAHILEWVNHWRPWSCETLVCFEIRFN